MPFLEYMSLALLGSAGAGSPGGTPAGPFAADAVTQPSGGTEGQGDFNAGIGLIGQDTGGCKAGIRRTGKGDYNHGHMDARIHTKTARHHRRGHRHTKVTGSTVSSSTGGTGGVKPNMNAPRPRRAPSN